MLKAAFGAVLGAALLSASTAPALSDGAASTRNLIFAGAAVSGFAVPAIVHRLRAKRASDRVVTRRQEAYRDWFYHKYGYYPTEDQFKQWYVQTYGVAQSPSPQR